MTGKELIQLIKKQKLEDYEFDFIFTDGYNTFPNIRTFKLTGITDIGHSNKTVLLDGEEQ